MTNFGWKNITFAVGLAWLLFGALTYRLVDWDVPVSLMMAACTYASAEWVVGAIWRRQYRQWPKALFLTWFSVAGSYNAYWILTGHRDRLVPDQWITSLCLYLLAGIIWSVLPRLPEALALLRAKTAGFASGRIRK